MYYYYVASQDKVIILTILKDSKGIFRKLVVFTQKA